MGTPRSSLSRRTLLAGLGSAPFWTPLWSRAAFGQTAAPPALPLKNPGLEHLDILVPDTAASAQVYMRIFRTALHQQPFQGGLRYFILLGDLPPNRQVATSRSARRGPARCPSGITARWPSGTTVRGWPRR